MKLSREVEYEIRKMETQARNPYLIHIHNDDYGDFYYANCDEEIYFEGHNYIPAYFNFNPPERTQSTIGSASITITALPDENSESWIEKIRGTQKRSKLEIVATIIIGGTEKIIEATETMTFELTNVSWNDETITWQMSFDDNMNILVPCDICSANTTPGCA